MIIETKGKKELRKENVIKKKEIKKKKKEIIRIKQNERKPNKCCGYEHKRS